MSFVVPMSGPWRSFMLPPFLHVEKFLDHDVHVCLVISPYLKNVVVSTNRSLCFEW